MSQHKEKAVHWRGNGGTSLLHWATHWERGEAALPPSLASVRLLVEAGVPVNVDNDFDQTPLHYACTTARKEGDTSAAIVTYLLNQGGDPIRKDNTNGTPIDDARETGNDFLLPLLGSKVTGNPLFAGNDDDLW